jgi:hypothetical protein
VQDQRKEKIQINKPKDEDTATVVVTLRLDIRVRHQEHRENNRNYVPAREDQATKTVISDLANNNCNKQHSLECIPNRCRHCPRVPRRERDHRRDLQQTHLQRVRRSDLHRECDVPAHSERHRVHELGRVRHKRK